MFKINFMGDVMLGRLIDQLLPDHVTEPSEASIVRNFRKSHPELENYTYHSPWGSALPLISATDLNVINLETSITTHDKKWPHKVFNYRMHPRNIKVLTAAGIDYAGLANNHTLDFGEEGLLETVHILKNANIRFARAGLNQQEAQKPAIFPSPGVPSCCDTESRERAITCTSSCIEKASNPPPEIHMWAASDHPQDWCRVPNFHLIDYTDQTKMRLKDLIGISDNSTQQVKIFSVHWGPNYAWEPSEKIQSLAHLLIDECGIDILHGHSSHHVQGVEIYKKKLIIYGCGDFVDDYALVAEFRNDLSAVWRVSISQQLERLEIFPTKITHFQAHLLSMTDPDHTWIREKVTALSAVFGPHVDKELGSEGQLVINIGNCAS